MQRADQTGRRDGWEGVDVAHARQRRALTSRVGASVEWTGKAMGRKHHEELKSTVSIQNGYFRLTPDSANDLASLLADGAEAAG